MGLFKMSEGNTCPPNPNPSNFRVIKQEGRVVEVIYGGCTTWNGHKLLLLRSSKVPAVLDPHLLGPSHIVMARFEPNEEGWKLAKLCDLLSKDKEILDSHVQSWIAWAESADVPLKIIDFVRDNPERFHKYGGRTLNNLSAFLISDMIEYARQFVGEEITDDFLEFVKEK